MADVDIPMTAGAGTLIRAYQRGAGDYDQYVREARGTAKESLGANVPWLMTTAGLTSVIAANTARVGLIIVNQANGILYVRFDATAPTPLAVPPLYDYFLNTGDRWEVPVQFAQLAQSWAGAAAGGYVLAAGTTCA